MTFIGALAILLTIAALPIASVRWTLGRFLVALGLLVLHLVATYGYYLYSQANVADTNFYFADILNFNRFPWSALGTPFVVHLTQLLKKGLGATYFDCFLAFQTFGFFGIMLLMRMFQEIHLNTRSPESAFPFYLLFLPSVHFWTVAIGKDGALFLAVTLAMWAAMNLSRRWIYFGLAMLLMVLFRVHIAMVSLAALAIATILHGRAGFGRKVILFGLTVVGVVVMIAAVRVTLDVDVTDPASLSSFMDVQTNVAKSDRAGMSIGQASFPVRALSLMFRPFFFDAPSILGMVASLENVLAIGLVIFFVRHRSNIAGLMKRVFAVRFALTFSLLVFVVLVSVYYNIGTGLRQRVMMFPPLFMVFVAAWALRRSRVSALGRTQPKRGVGIARTA